MKGLKMANIRRISRRRKADKIAVADYWRQQYINAVINGEIEAFELPETETTGYSI